MPWFRDKRVDRNLRIEQRAQTSGRGAMVTAARSRSRSQPVTRARLADMDARISDLESAIEALEDDADKWTMWWDTWKEFLTRMWHRFRYMT